jgi:hypothetical protein
MASKCFIDGAGEYFISVSDTFRPEAFLFYCNINYVPGFNFMILCA